jgi:hypothetical protein
VHYTALHFTAPDIPAGPKGPASILGRKVMEYLTSSQQSRAAQTSPKNFSGAYRLSVYFPSGRRGRNNLEFNLNLE